MEGKRLFLSLLYFGAFLQSHAIDEGCGYFVYEETPIPFNVCMKSQQTNSTMYYCDAGTVSFNEWDNDNCSADAAQTIYLNESDALSIYNCDASIDSLKNCNFANVDIWNNPYCIGSSYYALSYVVDVCISISANVSLYFGCNEDGTIQQTVYDNPQCFSSGALIVNSSVNDSFASNDAIASSCFSMSCNNKTYTSYSSPSSHVVGNSSFWNDPRSPELLFVIASGSVLVLFWTCYFYKKAKKKKTASKQNEELIANLQQDENDENIEENEPAAMAMTEIKDDKTVSMLSSE